MSAFGGSILVYDSRFQTPSSKQKFVIRVALEGLSVGALKLQRVALVPSHDL